jgi:hypothetical protein
LAEEIRSVVPVFDAADEFTVQALAVLLVRIERSEAALAQVEAEADECDEGPAAAYRQQEPWVENLRNRPIRRPTSRIAPEAEGPTVSRQ